MFIPVRSAGGGLHGKTISPSRVRGGKAAVAGRPPYHGRARTPCAPQHDKQPERKQKMIVKFITMKGVSGVDGPEHRGDPAPLWDGITPSTASPALHSAAFGGLLSARPRILWDSIPADGGVPPQLWNKTARKTRAKANKIKVSAGQLRSYGMVVTKGCDCRSWIVAGGIVFALVLMAVTDCIARRFLMPKTTAN